MQAVRSTGAAATAPGRTALAQPGALSKHGCTNGSLAVLRSSSRPMTSSVIAGSSAPMNVISDSTCADSGHLAARLGGELRHA